MTIKRDTAMATSLNAAHQGWCWAVEEAFASDAYSEYDVEQGCSLSPYAVTDMGDIVAPWTTQQLEQTDPDGHHDPVLHRDRVVEVDWQRQTRVRPAPAAHHAQSYEASAIAYDEAVETLCQRHMIEPSRRDDMLDGNPYRTDEIDRRQN
jgi:hypothetical protein